ncbi:MAG: glycine zipper 2TM domain-containing protein [Phenylobacterium sp.]|uniref:glycine zipper 2TM domain-containing protein n=1 Tax=Phenylobacterium sp. TaxID=1871053 RepID=UPI001A40F497|nr:glycine zipper 2TM domain-containing protein [Phenylobacterium sp.]MBL8555591.1 glycine zipper 2TM domain-containing protein [Phenylobacterium sp.]
MRHRLIAAGIAALTLVPSLAAAQQTCEERRANRAAGTVVGGVLGALAGSAIAGKGDRTEGAVIGGVGGAVIGNQVSKGDGDCRRAYGYYDNQNNWHSTGVSRSYAEGYYDRNGNWIVGAPPAGGWDRDGRWAMNAGSYGAETSYRTRSDWRDAPMDIRARGNWLEQRIVRSRNSGAISRREAQRAMDTLQDIRRDERRYMRDGRLNGRESDALMARLDDLNARVRQDRRD